jgi:hypothetical protein
MNGKLSRQSKQARPAQCKPWVRVRGITLLMAIAIVPGPMEPIWSQQTAQLGTLTAEKLKEMGTTVQLDINLVRVHPEILQNKQFMRYFIALNNCSNPGIKKTLDNELDYPRVESYYRSKAAEIVGALPSFVALAMFGGARSVHDPTITGDSLRLGEYDQSKGAFPLTFHAAWGSQKSAAPASGGTANNGAANNSGGNDPSKNITISLGSIFHKKSNNPSNANSGDDNTNHVAELEGAFDVHYNRENLYQTCPAANSETGHLFGVLPGDYTVNAQRMGFDVFPMSEADSLQYINNHAPTERGVTLGVYLRILDTDPAIEAIPNQPLNIRRVTFSGSEARVSIIDNKTGATLGNLMDNHSVPPEMTNVARSIPPPVAAPGGTETASALNGMNAAPASGATGSANTPSTGIPASMNNMGITTTETVMVESTVCNWPVPDDQQANLQRYLTEASQSPVWGPHVTVATRNARLRFSEFGTRAFCNSPVKRYEFNGLLSTLCPKGQIAAPDNRQ